MGLLRNEMKPVTNLKDPTACMGDIKISNIEFYSCLLTENQRTG